MALPRFLIVGAMKAGTTTLYRDLLTHPAIYFPIDKEPENLTDDRVLTDDGLAEYERLFREAGPKQICGEASTAYTKRPDVTGVPERALEVLGAELRIVYLVREPVSRTISHHAHAASQGEVDRDINRAVRECSMLIDYSRYAMQIEPWIDVFGSDRVKIVRFESYVKDRCGTVEMLCAFLGIEPRGDLVRVDEVFNKGTERSVNRGPFAVVQGSGLYQRVLRPLFPTGLRDRLRRGLLPQVDSPPPPPTVETRQYILDQVADDVARLGDLMELDGLVWEVG